MLYFFFRKVSVGESWISHPPMMIVKSENMENTLHDSLEQFLMRPLGPLSEDEMTSCSLTMEALNSSKLPAC